MDGYTRVKSGMGASGCVRRFEGREQHNITYTIEITLKGYWAIHSYTTRQGVNEKGCLGRERGRTYFSGRVFFFCGGGRKGEKMPFGSGGRHNKKKETSNRDGGVGIWSGVSGQFLWCFFLLSCAVRALHLSCFFVFFLFCFPGGSFLLLFIPHTVEQANKVKQRQSVSQFLHS